MGDKVAFYLACDPSTGNRVDRGDYTALVILARVYKSNLLYMIRCDLERMTLDQMIERIIQYHRKYRFTRVGIETNGFQTVAARDLRDRSRAVNLYIPVVELKNNRDKRSRIQSLQPLLKCGTLKLCKANRLFVEQLTYYPQVAHDDGLDALEMAVRIAEPLKEVTAKII